MKIFRRMRKNFNSATLAGTATLAAFLTAAASPAHAARHHHHHHHDNVSSDFQTASNDSGASGEAHRRHHHRRRHEDGDDSTIAQAPLHHRHHHWNDDDTASAPTEQHHRHHHRRHELDTDQVAAAPVDHRRRHHHHHRDDLIASYTHPEREIGRFLQSASAPTTHQERWFAHVTRYEEHVANVERAHEERLVMAEAHEDNVRATDRALASGNVIRAAEAFRGTPYIFGGTSRSGFDCSGFTRFILGRSAGVDLPRTAEEQYYIGQHIAKCDLEAGDLVFFQDTYRRGISHVGMYIGDGRFVHACNPSRGVTVSSLNERYYEDHWAGARRVLKLRSESGDL